MVSSPVEAKGNRLCVVVATSWYDVGDVMEALRSWNRLAGAPFDLVIVENGRGALVHVGDQLYNLGRLVRAHVPQYLAPVPAFALGVDVALASCPDAEVIACFHDDLWIREHGWDLRVLAAFDRDPQIGLMGFGGATGIGDEARIREQRKRDLVYASHPEPFDPFTLVRTDFASNMEGAENHGRRVTTGCYAACMDGFSQIFRREFAQGYACGPDTAPARPPFSSLKNAGVRHHAYDTALGILAASLYWKVWLEPVPCHHAGGRTAVGDAEYQAWAKQQTPEGDQGFWQQAHEIVWKWWGHLLPIRVEGRG